MDMKDPPHYAFPVLSKISKNGQVNDKNVKCPNCGRMHCVYEIGRSNVISGGSYRELDDVKRTLPDDLVKALDEHGCDYITYEECELAIKKRVKNNRKIILTREYSDGEITGKCVLIKKNGDFLLESYSYSAKDEVNFNG